MDTNLRPLTFSELLDRTAQLYRQNFLLFAGIAAVYAGAVMVIRLVLISVQHVLRSYHMVHQLAWFTGISVVVMWIGMLVLGGLGVAANNRAVAWVHLGQPATIRGAYASVMQRLGRYIWLMVITTTVVWLPVILLYAGYVVFIALYVRPRGLLNQAQAAGQVNEQAMVVFGMVSVVFALLLMAGIAYAVVMSLRYALAVPACVVEDTKARTSIRRGIELSKGSRGRILGFMLLVAVVQFILVLFTQTFFIVMAVRQHGQMSYVLQVAQQIVTFFTNTFVGPIYATGFTLFYYDQRVRKEGFDIEWMMQAAGLTPAPAGIPAETLPVTERPPESTHE